MLPGGARIDRLRCVGETYARMAQARRKRKRQQKGRRAEAKGAADAPRARRVHGLAAVAVALVTAGVFWSALDNGFVNWDDQLYVYENRVLQTPELRTVKWYATAIVSNNWHPLTLLSYQLDYSLWGLDPRGYHLTNVLLHAVNAGLVFLLVVALFPRGNDGRGDPHLWVTAGLVALGFGIHPLRVESVAWISERKDVLYALFFLLSTLTYLAYARSSRHRGVLYAGSLALFALSLASKPMAVTLPLVLLILDACPLHRLSWRALAEKIPFVLLSGAAASVAMWSQFKEGPPKPWELAPVATRLLVAVKGYGFYLYKMAWPLELAPLYPYPESAKAVLPFAALSAVVIAALTALAVRAWKTTRAPLALWSCYLVLLLPVMGLVKVGEQSAADRYTYLASVPVLLGAGLLLRRAASHVGGRAATAVLAAVGVVLALWAVQTRRQIPVWSDPESLWKHEIAAFPGRVPKAHNNLGDHYYNSGRPELAIEQFTAAVEQRPGHVNAWYNRGLARAAIGQRAEAIEDFTQAVTRDPGFVDGYFSRGMVRAMQGASREAIEDLTRAIELFPGHYSAYNSRGNLHARLGRWNEAIEDFSKALELAPNPRFRVSRGVAFLNTGRARDALEDFTAAVRMNDRDPLAHFHMGNAYAALGERDKARSAFERAAQRGSREARDALSRF